jgi:hypothetical protein
MQTMDRSMESQSSGNVVILAESTVSWISKRASTIAASRTVAEHTTLTHAINEMFWHNPYQ